MNHLHQLAVLGLVAVGVLLDAGCTGSPQQCGDRMTQVGSACVVGPFPCTDGTKLNPETNACEIDPTACRSGTVLVNHQCVDPTASLTVDVEEAAEPNGVVEFRSAWPQPSTVLEPNWQSAGAINLRPAGEPGVVVHGCVVPTASRPADFDGYTITVDRPTLLHVSADGINGLSAGFVFVAEQDPLPADMVADLTAATLHDLRDYIYLRDWLRIGLSAVSDYAQREVYLPLPGRYRMFVTDSRTLLPLTTVWSDVFTWNYVPEPAGNADGSGCYYVTVEQRSVPPPTRLDLNAGDSGTITSDIKFYTAPDFGDGFTGVNASIDSPDAKVAFALFNNGHLRQTTYDFGVLTPGREFPGQLFFGGILPGDRPLLVLDHLYALGEPSYKLDVYARIPAQPLPTSGGTVVSTLKGTNSVIYPPPLYFPIFDRSALNLFYFDVATARELTGMKLHFSLPVQGNVHDGDANRVAFFYDTYGPVSTYTDYQGIIRTPAPGRYYFWISGPRNTVGDAFSVTSTYARVTPAASATVDVPSGPIPLDPVFGSTIVNYDPGPGAAWQLFNATGTDMTDVVATLIDPARSYGRLDRLTTTIEADPPTIDEPPSLQRFSFPQNGSTPAGHVVFGMPSPMWLNVHASAPGPSPTFNLNVTTGQIQHNFDRLAVPSTTTLTGQTLTALTPNNVRRYFFSAPASSVVTITATPTSGFRTAARRLMIASLNRDETDNVVFDSPVAGPEVARYRIPPESVGDTRLNFNAIVVRAAQAAAGTFDLTVSVDPPFYSAHRSTTPFTDACAGGNTIAMTADGTIDFITDQPRRADDQGLSAPIATPAGFQFYGTSVSSFVVSTNGFISFDPAITSSDSTREFPDGAGKSNIAPFAQDLTGMKICSKTVGTSLIIQWGGFAEMSPVQFQVILHSADQSIEFVYGPNHTSHFFVFEASGGVQDTSGFDGTPTFLALGYVAGSNYPEQNTAVKFTHP